MGGIRLRIVSGARRIICCTSSPEFKLQEARKWLFQTRPFGTQSPRAQTTHSAISTASLWRLGLRVGVRSTFALPGTASKNPCLSVPIPKLPCVRRVLCGMRRGRCWRKVSTPWCSAETSVKLTDWPKKYLQKHLRSVAGASCAHPQGRSSKHPLSNSPHL